jgi:hypothetical protein
VDRLIKDKPRFQAGRKPAATFPLAVALTRLMALKKIFPRRFMIKRLEFGLYERRALATK